MKTVEDLSSKELAELYAETGIDLSGLAPVAKPVEVAAVVRTSVDALAQDRYRVSASPTSSSAGACVTCVPTSPAI